MSRVFLITPYYVPFVGGTTAFLRAMTERLATDGWGVTVLTTTARQAADFWQPSAEPLLPLHETLAGVEVERLPFCYPRPVPLAFGLLRRAGHWLHRSGLPAAVQRPLLRRLAQTMPALPGLDAALARLTAAADLIQAADSSWDGLFTAATATALRYHKPFIACPLMHLGGDAVRAHFQMAHQVDAYRSANAVLALSDQEGAEYIRLGVTPERVHLLAMGVEPIQPADDPVAVATFRQRFNLQGPLVAFIGANTYDKGAFTLALTAAELAAAGTPVTLVYAGPGSDGLTEFLTRQPADIRARLQDRVHILGVVDEPTKHQLLAACDLLALPSQVDTFGIVLLEAWAYGKPVIGAAVGGIPDLVRAGQDGLLTPFGDVAALAAAIRQLAFDPDLASRLGAAGRKRVLQEFTWDRTYQTLSGIYAAVLANDQF